MAVLRYRDTFSRFPEYSDAIHALKPGCSFGISMNDYETLYWQIDDNKSDPPTEDEIKAKLLDLIKEWEIGEYRRQRYHQYPVLEEQLALLWDDMNSGKIPGKESSEWFKKIQEVKNDIPKGTTTTGPDTQYHAAIKAHGLGLKSYYSDRDNNPVETTST